MVVAELARKGFNAAQVHLFRRLRKNLNAASIVWTAVEYDAETVRGISGRSPRSMLEVSTPPGITSRIRSYDGSRPLTLCWSGAHFNRKALPILLHALASSSQRERISLVVLSAGQLTGRWMELAARLGLGEQIRWTGYLPRVQALEEMNKADVFVHTSVREGAPSVIVESFAMGLPVISHDAFGMSVALNDRCGIKVPFIGPKESIAGFRNAIERFIFEPELVQKLSEGALQRAAELTWEAKVVEISDAYRESVEATMAGRGAVVQAVPMD
jgi:glycosyltransferase involved in cell wall biosynthesis